MKAFFRLVLLSTFFATSVPLAALAQDDEIPGERPGGDDDLEAPSGPSNPSRILLTVGAGVSLRIVKNRAFAQDQVAPAFVDVLGAFVLPGAGTWRHGIALGVSTNLSGDGAEIGVDPLGQFFLEAEYLAYFRLSDTFQVLGHVGPIFGWSKNSDEGSFDPIIGLEVAGGASLLLLAGFGIYAEASLSAFLGRDDSVHPIVSGEAGLIIDYEVLP